MATPEEVQATLKQIEDKISRLYQAGWTRENFRSAAIALLNVIDEDEDTYAGSRGRVDLISRVMADPLRRRVLESVRFAMYDTGDRRLDDLVVAMRDVAAYLELRHHLSPAPEKLFVSPPDGKVSSAFVEIGGYDPQEDRQQFEGDFPLVVSPTGQVYVNLGISAGSLPDMEA